jgi:hypothetical protein
MAAEGETKVIAFSFCALTLVNIGTEYLLLIVTPLQRNPDSDSIDYDGFEPMSLAVMIHLTLFSCLQIGVNIPIKVKNPRIKKVLSFEDNPDLSLAPCTVYVSEGETFLTQKE